MPASVGIVDLIALFVSIAALVIAGLAALYARRQAIAAEDSNDRANEAVFRVARRHEGGEDGADGRWLPRRDFRVLENIGNGRAVDVRITVLFDKTGRTYGKPNRIDVIEAHSEAEIVTRNPLPEDHELVDIRGKQPYIEQIEVEWVASDGDRRTKRIPLAFA